MLVFPLTAPVDSSLKYGISRDAIFSMHDEFALQIQTELDENEVKVHR